MWLSILSYAVTYSYQKWVYYKIKHENQSVVKLVDTLMPVLNNYYRTECYANAGVVAASLTLTDLKTAGYIQSTFPSPIKGTLELQIDTATPYTEFNIIVDFPTEADALDVSLIKGRYLSSLSGTEVTWSASTSLFREDYIDNDVDINLFGTSSCF